MKFKDYIFYRMYQNYQKANEGIFSVVMFFTLLEYFLLAPFIIIFVKKSNITNDKNLIFYLAPMLIVFLFNCIRYYNKKRVARILSRYKNNKYNKIIKNWMIYSLLFISLTWGLFGIVPIMELYLYIKDSFI